MFTGTNSTPQYPQTRFLSHLSPLRFFSPFPSHNHVSLLFLLAPHIFPFASLHPGTPSPDSRRGSVQIFDVHDFYFEQHQSLVNDLFHSTFICCDKLVDKHSARAPRCIPDLLAASGRPVLVHQRTYFLSKHIVDYQIHLADSCQLIADGHCRIERVRKVLVPLKFLRCCKRDSDFFCPALSVERGNRNL